MRQLLFSLLVAIAALVVLQLGSADASVFSTSCGSGGNKTHNYFFGAISYNDRLLYSEHIQFKSKWLRVISIDKDYPAKGTPPKGKISYIEVLDQRSDGTGGCAYISNGGVGNNFVTIHLKSQRNHGMEFKINIYGH